MSAEDIAADAAGSGDKGAATKSLNPNAVEFKPTGAPPMNMGANRNSNQGKSKGRGNNNGGNKTPGGKGRRKGNGKGKGQQQQQYGGFQDNWNPHGGMMMQMDMSGYATTQLDENFKTIPNS